MRPLSAMTVRMSTEVPNVYSWGPGGAAEFVNGTLTNQKESNVTKL